jgi:hypothetical protein
MGSSKHIIIVLSIPYTEYPLCRVVFNTEYPLCRVSLILNILYAEYP